MKRLAIFLFLRVPIFKDRCVEIVKFLRNEDKIGVKWSCLTFFNSKVFNLSEQDFNFVLQNLVTSDEASFAGKAFPKRETFIQIWIGKKNKIF